MSKTRSNTRKETKSDAIQRLLNRKAGADIGALQKATGWQAHSVRAALSMLRKAGYQIDRLPPKTKDGRVAYKITGEPAET